jgi:hypothetical protein
MGRVMVLFRCLALCFVVGLVGCKAPEKPVFEAFDFEYLTKIKINVAAIEIEDAWVPRGAARHVEYLAPTRPVKALRLMAEHRLVTGGTVGQAIFAVDDASIILYRGRFEGSFAVHLEVQDAEGQQIGMASARVRDSLAARDEGDTTTSQIDLEALMRRMMEKMNVEFEYQVRQALKASLQTTSPAAPQPEAVEKQELTGAPEAVPGVVAPAAPAVPDAAPVLTLSPPPGVLTLPGAQVPQGTVRLPLRLAPPAAP